MPHFHEQILVVRYDELVPEFYASIDSLKNVISRANRRGYGMKRVQRACYTKDALIEFDSLPSKIKDALGDPRKTGHILERFYVTSSEAVEYFSNYKFADGSYLNDSTQERYITNASVLNAIDLLKAAREQERTNKGYSTKGIFNSLTSDATSFNEVLKARFGVSHNLPSNPVRFKQTFTKYMHNGFISLISKYHKNDNSKKVTDTTLELINSLFAGTEFKPTATEVAKQYESFLNGYVEVTSRETGEIFSPKGYPKLSKASIANYLASWENKIGNYAKRAGDRQKLLNKFSVYHSLEKPQFAGEILSIDDRQPPFKYSENKRAWFYMGIDLGSEAWTVWVHGTTKEGIILDFYRQLVRNYHDWGINLPAELEAESSLNSTFKQTFLKEGRMFQHVRIEANKARAKKVERYFGNLRYQYEKQRTGWVARPFAGSESNELGSANVPLVPYNEIVNNSLQDIEDWNNSPHSVHKDKTRWEVFTEMQHPEIKPTNYKQILPYLGYKTETSCNAGIVKLQGQEWLLGLDNKISKGNELIQLMKEVEGEDLDVYWLDANDGSVLKAIVYHRNGDRFICELLPKPTYSRSKIGRKAGDDEKRTIMSAYANTIDGFMKKRKNEVQKVLVVDETPKTLNNKFKIVREPRKTLEENYIEKETEILEELPDEFEMALEYGSQQSQFDRF